MTAGTARRPLPALVFLLALTLLTALVWWRVLHRSSPHPLSSPKCVTRSTQAVLPQPATVTVTVLNSTQRAGIAKAAAASLTKLGFSVVSYGNDGHGVIAGVAEIRYAPANQAAAMLLSYYLPGAKLVTVAATSTAEVTISLGMQYKAVATAAAARAAMTAAHISAAPSTPATATSSAAGC